MRDMFRIKDLDNILIKGKGALIHLKNKSIYIKSRNKYLPEWYVVFVYTNSDKKYHISSNIIQGDINKIKIGLFRRYGDFKIYDYRIIEDKEGDNEIMSNKLTETKVSPRLPKLLKWIGENTGHNTILNYGAGLHYKYHAEHMKNEYGAEVESYDPNIQEINIIPDKPYDCIVCSNVFNIIPEDEEINKILDRFDEMNKKGAKIYISIFVGQGTGIGKITTIGTYQRNMKVSKYDYLLAPRGYKQFGQYWEK